MYCSFDYSAPETVEQLLALLKEQKEQAALYAGGTDLLIQIRAHTKSVKHIIDIKKIPEFQVIELQAEALSIGAAVPFSKISTDPFVKENLPVLSEAAQSVGSPGIQNRATLAGNIQNASPAGDGLLVAYAVDGSLCLISPNGSRIVPVRDFVIGNRETILQRNEVIGRVLFPRRRWSFQRFFKVGRRNALAISVVSGAVAVDYDSNGVVNDARIGLGAVAKTPVRVYEAEDSIVGRTLTLESIEKACTIITEKISPISDYRASAAYRKYVAVLKVRNALRECAGITR